MFKARNVIEAGILAVIFGLPVFYLPISLTARIIVLCLTALPLALVALIGISGESLSAFVLIFFRYLRHRRVIEPVNEDENASAHRGFQKFLRNRKSKHSDRQEKSTKKAKKGKETKAKKKRKRAKSRYSAGFYYWDQGTFLPD